MKGIATTKRHIVAYICVFVMLCILLGVYGGASMLGVMIVVLTSGYWLYLAADKTVEDVRWSRKQFGWSLVTLLVLSVSLALDSFWH